MPKTARSRRSLAAAVVAAASIGSLVTAAPIAAADESRCPAGKFCVFQYQYYEGEMKIISSTQPTLGTWDNRISSFVNNSAMWVLIDTSPRFGYEEYSIISPHRGGISLGSALDNRISSIRLSTTEREAGGSTPWLNWTSSDTKRPTGLPAVAQFGDLNNDRVADLVERADDGRLWFLSGVRDSTFNGTGALIGGGWNSMTQIVRHGDYDGDGNEDVFARDTTGVLWLYPGNGKGWFKPRVKVGGGWNTMKELKAVGDITGDGRRDLVARDTAGVLWTYPGNGRGWFGARKKVGGGWNTMTRLAAPGDMTGDGRADLLARDASRGLWLYPGNGQGAFGARKKMPYAWPSNESLMATGDINGDGKSDILRTIDGTMYLHTGDGRGGISGPESFGDWDSAPRVHVF
ncbi:FG-GAP-like repeat-containing protein [Streptomyces sp. NPDC053792]|uniref:FG-GAP-like repeat-containing protein n=1 Tax=Streptomyces sp. NPDC053792 TaxID=3365716 RepID=UPI0037D2F331